ncbi:hypothetical protein SAMN05421690_100417 [Nitrosomonas sp. Nm51]|uniref:surface-adhesin E family protein n=1 Tax=Nitrosomonas sp. Nm51 TaxID=133720 RepID=UPI0008D4EF45|nr:surface-adhesin E family protein [Nitrosomonas sp. Nm51]SEQ94381.1 hypothetical protein SAMN05421690_100417 [Nitrosomonas sp. Nm51]
MKKILIILTLILISLPAWADWTQIGENDSDDGYIVYADLISAQSAGGRVKMWVLYDYKTEQKASGTNFLSKKIRRDYNCREAGIRTLAFSLFSWNMEKGELLRSYNQPQQWERVQPGSMKAVEWKTACEKP